jgi:hypothetical protein
LNRPSQRERWRAAVFVGVVSLHLFAGLLLLSTKNIRIFVARREQEAPLTLLSLAAPHRPPLDDAGSQSGSKVSNQNKRELPKSIDRAPVAESSNAITAPNVNWDAEAKATVQQKNDDDEAEKRRRNLAGPSDSQLDWARNNAAPRRDHHEAGDEERAEGGELITWVSDKCYWTTHGFTTLGMPQTQKICKDPFKPNTEMFKDMGKKLDERAINRLP